MPVYAKSVIALCQLPQKVLFYQLAYRNEAFFPGRQFYKKNANIFVCTPLKLFFEGIFFFGSMDFEKTP